MDILLDAHGKTDKECDACGHPAVPPTQRNHQICVHDVSTVLCVSVARRLMTVTAASDKRIIGFSGGEDVIFDDDRALINYI